MSSRKKIEQACRDAGFIIANLHYHREHVPVPEEMVPLGWILEAQVSEEPDDIMEITGSVDDVISTIHYESKLLNTCSYCGDDRTGKGSLIADGRVFCNDDHYEEWHAAVRAKQAEKYS